MNFKLHSDYKPTGDQPEAIRELVQGFREGNQAETLLGVTGSGKTFTMANVIAELNKPTLIISHNKTLAAQTYSEMKEFFPENAVEYFVSYYDYYQPEAYVPSSDTYIAKDSAVNDEIDKLRLSALSSLSERRDVVIVSSVSCIYGIGAPDDFMNMMTSVRPGMQKDRDTLIGELISMQYERNEVDFHRGTFRVKGDTLEVIPADENEYAIRVEFFGDEIDRVSRVDILTGEVLADLTYAPIYVEMMRETGFCSGIENYSRHLTGRAAGQPPYTLMDYFNNDFLIIVDESHMTIPQIGAMYNGDRSRKQTLVDYGFRLPSALDNRPLSFNEFEERIDQILFVSATPGKYEEEHELLRAEQVIRPTGLLDPDVEVRPVKGQIDDLVGEIRKEIGKHHKVMITTLTKKMAEDLTDYLKELDIRVRYLHSDIDTLERTQIIRDMRLDVFDVLVGTDSDDRPRGPKLRRPCHYVRGCHDRFHEAGDR